LGISPTNTTKPPTEEQEPTTGEQESTIGDQQLLFPARTPVYSNAEQPLARATFYVPADKEYLAAANSNTIQILDPAANCAVVARSPSLSVTPRALVADGEFLFYAGTMKSATQGCSS
jgi:hypothetical protein